MHNDESKNKIFGRRTSGRVAQIVLTVLFLLSVIVTAARADVDSPTVPAEPNAYDTLPSSIFGVEIGPKVDVNGGLDYIKPTYTRYVRGPEIIWKDVEPIKGSYDWTKIDEAVTEIKNALLVQAVDPIVVVRGTPSWAQKQPPYSCGPIAQAEFGSFANFMFNLIGELNTPARGNIKIKYWEIWNEPDIAPNPADPDQPWGGCWGDASDAYFGGGYYGEMLKAIYPTIKTKDPNAQVIVGGLLMDCDPLNPPVGKTCTSSKFLEGILRAGAGNSFDGVAFHAFDYAIKSGGLYQLGQYHNPNWPGSAWNADGPVLKAKARYLKGLLDSYRAQYGYGPKYLMNTELALLDCEFCTNTNPYPSILETTKSYYLAQAYAASIAEGLKATIWYDVRGSWLRNNGLVKLGATYPNDKLEAMGAYEFAANQTGSPIFGGAEYVSAINYPGITGYEFRFSNPNPNPPYYLLPFHVWVVWSKDGQPHTLSLPSLALEVYDVQGNIIFEDVNTLTITLQPYYIVLPEEFPRNYLTLMKRPPLLVNGGFEDGLTSWTVVNENGMPVSLVTTNPLDPLFTDGVTRDTNIPIGTTSVVLGDPTKAYGQSAGNCSFPNVPKGYGAVEQTISVPTPPAGFKVWLSFNFIMYSQDLGISSSFDRFEVYVKDGVTDTLVYFMGNTQIQGAPDCAWYRIPSVGQPVGSASSGWATASVDLSSYAGKSVTLSFRNYNRIDGWYNTYTFLDQVNVSFAP